MMKELEKNWKRIGFMKVNKKNMHAKSTWILAYGKNKNACIGCFEK